MSLRLKVMVPILAAINVIFALSLIAQNPVSPATNAEWIQADNMRAAGLQLTQTVGNELDIIHRRLRDQNLGKKNHVVVKAIAIAAEDPSPENLAAVEAAKADAMMDLYLLQQNLVRLEDGMTSMTQGLAVYKPAIDNLVGTWTPPEPE